MPEKIIISDTNPEPYDDSPFKYSGINGSHGKRFYGQKDIPDKPTMCLTTLWESSFHSPSKYLGTYEVEKRARNHQDLSHVTIVTEKTNTKIPIQATKVDDDVALKKWVTLVYRWIPAGLILSLGIAALLATLVWV